MVEDRDLVSLQEVRTKVDKAYAAWEKYRAFTQEQADRVVEAVAAAGRAHARPLAELAVEETGYGNVKDKIAKNLLNADLLPRKMRGLRVLGVLREIPEEKIVEIGVPVGVVAAILPTTNPTSTAIFKSLISLKAGNAAVVAPHPRAIRSTCATVEILAKAAVEAGAPEGILQCLYQSTLEGTNELMRHRRTAVILATGGAAMVRAAYSSGKPAYGVGPGNVPVLVDTSADIPDAVAKVVAGKSFDYGTVCSSEQALIAEESLKPAIVAELKAGKAFFCDDRQKKALEKTLLKSNFRINPDCVGQSPTRIAQMAGFEVPADTSILVVELEGIGKQHPLSVEKLSPVLALVPVKDFAAAMDACEAVLRFGGLGHTCVIFSKDDARIREFALRMPAMRVMVNTSAPQGSTGITTNLWPSMTLGCGAMAGNVTSDNVGPKHLTNIKRLAYAVRTPEEAMPADSSAPGAASAIDRRTVLAAVEKYLAQRGIAVSGAPAEKRAAPAPASAAIAGVAAQVVDKLIASRRATAASCPVPPSASGCGCVYKPSAPAPEKPAPAPPVTVVDFVCESDVRAAIQKSQKIFIGPKTIVTPAARELAAPHDILVLAQR